MTLFDIKNENNNLQYQKLNRKMRKIFPLQDKESLIAQLKEFKENPILKIESDEQIIGSIQEEIFHIPKSLEDLIKIKSFYKELDENIFS